MVSPSGRPHHLAAAISFFRAYVPNRYPQPFGVGPTQCHFKAIVTVRKPYANHIETHRERTARTSPAGSAELAISRNMDHCGIKRNLRVLPLNNSISEEIHFPSRMFFPQFN